MQNIIEHLKEKPLIWDGPMGTMIYSKGIFINTCYDELSLTKPELITGIHEEYRVAGANILETNTFGANRIKLKEFGIEEKTVPINRISVELAKKVAATDTYVAGAVGPCSRHGETYLEKNNDQYYNAFEEQCSALSDAGADFIQLETFSNLRELIIAARAAKSTGLPVLASFSVNEEGVSIDGNSAERFTKDLVLDNSVDIVGINCGLGPAGAYEVLKNIINICTKPLIVMPNSGLPRDIGGRVMYMTSPDYFAKYAKRFIQLGARGIGGCCGITPVHIQKAVKGIKNLSEINEYQEVKIIDTKQRDDIEIKPVEKKSGFAAKLVAGKKVSSIEILSPMSVDFSLTLEKINRCREKGSDAVNIPDGPRASARASNLISSIRFQNETGLEIIPHFCCRDRNLMAMQGDIMAAYASGICNLLLVTGDPPSIGNYPDMTGVFDLDAIGLTQMVNNLNHGYDLAGNQISMPTSILIGVAANPCAVDLKREIERFKSKVDAGAEYAISQPVFEPDVMKRFMDQTAKHSKTIPLVAGVWPLASFRNAQFMATEVPGVVVPNSIIEKMRKCNTKEDARKTGIEIAQDICEKIQDYVSGFQVSAPFGNVDTALKVLGKIN